jgi:hypothetical protein
MSKFRFSGIAPWSMTKNDSDQNTANISSSSEPITFPTALPSHFQAIKDVFLSVHLHPKHPSWFRLLWTSDNDSFRNCCDGNTLLEYRTAATIAFSTHVWLKILPMSLSSSSSQFSACDGSFFSSLFLENRSLVPLSFSSSFLSGCGSSFFVSFLFPCSDSLHVSNVFFFPGSSPLLTGA